MKIYEVVLNKKWNGSPNDHVGIVGGRSLHRFFISKEKAEEYIYTLTSEERSERDAALWKMEGYSYQAVEREVIE